MELEQSQADLTRLWSLLKPPPGHYIRYFAKKKFDGITHTTGGVIEDGLHLSLLAEKFRINKWDAYIQLNPTAHKREKRASAEDVSIYSWFMLDVDPDGQPQIGGAAKFSFEVPIATGLQKKAFLHLDTGRGRQVWFRATPIELSALGNDKILRERLRWMNQKIQESIILWEPHQVVDVLPDLPRLARMPWTINTKTGRLAQVIAWPKNDPWFRPEVGLEWAGDPPPPPETVNLPQTTWQQAFPHLTKTAKEFIMDGVDSPGRHHAAVAAARSLRDAQIPYDGALVAVLQGAQRCRPAVDSDSSFTTAEVMRITAGAYNIG